jgi:uncharacterized protein YndB with AHSA1/START domain
MTDLPPPGITIVRVLDAPRERVWAEWTEPASFADWYGGEHGEVPVDTVTMDVRAGGALRLTMFAGGREIAWHGEYQEVVEPERLVFAISDQPGDERFELITVVLTDLGDGRTEMRMEQRGGLTPEQYKHAGSGWGTFFDRLEDRLTAH